VDTSAGRHRSSLPVAAAPNLLRDEEATTFLSPAEIPVAGGVDWSAPYSRLSRHRLWVVGVCRCWSGRVFIFECLAT
jgi:hypothetical protein